MTSHYVLWLCSTPLPSFDCIPAIQPPHWYTCFYPEFALHLSQPVEKLGLFWTLLKTLWCFPSYVGRSESPFNAYKALKGPHCRELMCSQSALPRTAPAPLSPSRSVADATPVRLWASARGSPRQDNAMTCTWTSFSSPLRWHLFWGPFQTLGMTGQPPHSCLSGAPHSHTLLSSGLHSTCD